MRKPSMTDAVIRGLITAINITEVECEGEENTHLDADFFKASNFVDKIRMWKEELTGRDVMTGERLVKEAVDVPER